MTSDAGLTHLLISGERAANQNSIRTSPFGTLQHDKM
jgi:hypothetical protein